MNASPEAVKPGTKRRKRLRLLALLIGVVFALLIAELALQVGGVIAEPKRHFSPGVFAPSAELGWGLVPSYRGEYRTYTARIPTTTNAAGYRGPALGTRSSAVLRVVALGDSCTFGMGVADDATYPAQLEQKLTRPDREAVVFNLGVMGYDTHQAADVWERVAADYAPEVVVLTWLPNDTTLPEARFGAKVFDGHLAKDREQYEGWRARQDHEGLYASALYRVLRVRSRHIKQRLGIKRGEWSPEWIDAEALAPSLDSLGRIQARCKAIGARLIVLLMPRENELSGDSSLAHYARVRAHAEGLGASVIDVPTLWRESRPEGELYLFRDATHFTPLGYAALADLVAEAIRTR